MATKVEVSQIIAYIEVSGKIIKVYQVGAYIEIDVPITKQYSPPIQVI